MRTKGTNRRHKLITTFGMVLPKLSCLVRLLGSPCNRDTETVSGLIDVEPPHKDLQQSINTHLREFDKNKPSSNPPQTPPERTRKNSCTISDCLMPSLSKPQSPSSSLILPTSSLLVVCIAACKLRYAP